MSNSAPPSISSHYMAEHQFLASKDTAYTYGDLEKVEHFFADFLHDYAPSSSHPVGVWADSSDLTVFAIAACWKLNIPFVCLNPKARQKTLKRQIKALHPALIITDISSKSALQGIKLANIIELDLSEILRDPRYSKQEQSNRSTSNANHIFGFFFTSGTSAKPKIVPLKRRQMLAAAAASAMNIKPEPNHYWLLCMPLHHIGGVSLILRSLLYGSAIYRMEHFDSNTVSDFLKRDERVSVASLVPTMLKRLLDDPSFKTHSHFQGILLGGGPISPNLLQICISRKIPVIPSYGMTETCAQIAANPITPKSKPYSLGSVGRIFSPNDIEIRGASNQKLKRNQSGSIWLKGPQIFDGYVNKHNGHSPFDECGWFNTGDFGRLDEKGQLYVEARRTDMIISGGENISPFEVEAALEALPGIKEAAVFGMADKQWGQRVVAAVVHKTGASLTPVEIKEILKTKLEAFKIPKHFVSVNALPRTQNGKIHRSELTTLLN